MKKTITVDAKDFERCLMALRVINTWASFKDGYLLLHPSPRNVIDLTEKALKPFRLKNGKRTGAK